MKDSVYGAPTGLLGERASGANIPCRDLSHFNLNGEESKQVDFASLNPKP